MSGPVARFSFNSIFASMAFLLSLGCGAAPTALPVDTQVPAAIPAAETPAPSGGTGAPTRPPTATAAPTPPAVRTPAPTPRPTAAPSRAPATTVARTLGASSTQLTLAAGGAAVVALVAGDRPAQVRLSGGGAEVARYGLAHAPEVAHGTARDVALRHFDRRFDGLRPDARYRLQALPEVAVGDTDTFWVIADQVGDEFDEREVKARCVHVGRHSLVWVDASVGGVIDERAIAMGQAFDSGIYPTNTRLFGEPVANDHDPRVSILISPEVDDRGGNTTIGYFSARDLFSLDDAPELPELAHSNSRLIIFASAGVVARGRASDVLGTLAHEFQHLISATRKLFGPTPTTRQEALWLNEALSMYAMEANGYGLRSGARVVADHVAAYLARPEDYPLVSWDEAPEGSSYGAAYLFALYLAERAGERIMADLVAAPEFGVANVDKRLAAKGLSFERLFRDWAAANLLDGSGRPADAVHAYQAIDLRGAYAGHRLRGPAVTSLDLPFAVRTTMLPWTARYLQLTSDASRTWDLGLAGLGFAWLWTP